MHTQAHMPIGSCNNGAVRSLAACNRNDRSVRRLAYVGGLIIISALTMSAKAKAEAASAVAVSGGLLDPAYPNSEIYLEKPIAATPPPLCRVADKYVGLLNTEQFGKIHELYSDDAVVMSPHFRMRAVGGAAIDNFYRTVVGPHSPKIVAVSYASAPGECFMVMSHVVMLDGKQRYTLGAVDHFKINVAGKITQMIAYGRPPETKQPQAADH